MITQSSLLDKNHPSAFKIDPNKMINQIFNKKIRFNDETDSKNVLFTRPTGLYFKIQY